MKKSILLSLLALLITLVSCTKNENNYYTVENVTVQLNSKELLETVVKPFKASTKMSSSNSTTEYEHQFPSSYTAYFISKETKGEYTKGQLITTISVVAGGNTITVPKLDYDVIVTNYTKEGNWYTWNDAIQQLPQTSQELYLYGKTSIDYSSVTVGTVELTNPYAAVMITDNEWVNGTPTSHDTNQDYFKASGWYILYIRNNNTNTKIPVSIASYSSDTYTLKRDISPNHIYQFIIDGSVKNIEGGILGVTVKPFEKPIEEIIKF